MPRLERSNPLGTAAAAAIGVAVGLILQFGLSSRGMPTLVPPLTLPTSLVLIAGALLVLGLRLRRLVRTRPGAVNPFQAVRLLAAARAAQIVGALLGGFGGGLALSLVGRSVPAPSSTWLPMLLAVAGGAILVACAAVTEHLCRVPPGDDPETGADETEPGPADQAAYRKP
ncbi:DUF3180 family protein [Leucobacter zeae]|nr:DUF3180 family protein [Leucobacter zeae]